MQNSETESTLLLVKRTFLTVDLLKHLDRYLDQSVPKKTVAYPIHWSHGAYAPRHCTVECLLSHATLLPSRLDACWGKSFWADSTLHQ